MALRFEAMGAELARDRNMHLLIVTAFVHAKWPPSECASNNICLLQNLKWQPCTQFQNKISKHLGYRNNLIIKM